MNLRTESFMNDKNIYVLALSDKISFLFIDNLNSIGNLIITKFYFRSLGWDSNLRSFRLLVA